VAQRVVDAVQQRPAGGDLVADTAGRLVEVGEHRVGGEQGDDRAGPLEVALDHVDLLVEGDAELVVLGRDLLVAGVGHAGHHAQQQDQQTRDEGAAAHHVSSNRPADHGPALLPHASRRARRSGPSAFYRTGGAGA
jgi:hypothetical protein